MSGAASRGDAGRRAGYFGLAMNSLLCVSKFLAGLHAGSLAVLSDAVNNLSDIASSGISVAGFVIASRPADEKHPYGHARFEYIASSAVAVLILALGFNLGFGSVQKILHPVPLTLDRWVVGVLVFSVLLKLAMFFHYRRASRKLDSVLLQAAAEDSISDVYATSALLLAFAASHWVDYPVDGWAGLAVSIFIVKSGFSVLLKTYHELMGAAPDPRLLETIREHLLQAPAVLGVHDLRIHGYGPNVHFATAHVEMDAEAQLMVSHRVIDRLEREIGKMTGVQLVLHMDPIWPNHPEKDRFYEMTKQAVLALDEEIDLHDFRLAEAEEEVEGKIVHYNDLIFELDLPDRLQRSNAHLRQQLEEELQRRDASIRCFITLDRHYETDMAYYSHHQDHFI